MQLEGCSQRVFYLCFQIVLSLSQNAACLACIICCADHWLASHKPSVPRSPLMQAFQERYVLLVDTSEIDSARSDISETVNEFVRRPGSGRRKTHIPWRSPWDASEQAVDVD